MEQNIAKSMGVWFVVCVKHRPTVHVDIFQYKTLDYARDIFGCFVKIIVVCVRVSLKLVFRDEYVC